MPAEPFFVHDELDKHLLQGPSRVMLVLQRRARHARPRDPHVRRPMARALVSIEDALAEARRAAPAESRWRVRRARPCSFCGSMEWRKDKIWAMGFLGTTVALHEADYRSKLLHDRSYTASPAVEGTGAARVSFDPFTTKVGNIYDGRGRRIGEIRSQTPNGCGWTIIVCAIVFGLLAALIGGVWYVVGSAGNYLRYHVWTDDKREAIVKSSGGSAAYFQKVDSQLTISDVSPQYTSNDEATGGPEIYVSFSVTNHSPSTHTLTIVGTLGFGLVSTPNEDYDPRGGHYSAKISAWPLDGGGSTYNQKFPPGSTVHAFVSTQGIPGIWYPYDPTPGDGKFLGGSVTAIGNVSLEITSIDGVSDPGLPNTPSPTEVISNGVTVPLSAP